jgi:PPOX class probable F420-dependent enzyme
VARLATLDATTLRPEQVPICFVLLDEVVYTAVDQKPKTTRQLKRLANIANRPEVSLLVDHYDEDWSQLWWIRLDGVARIVTEPAEQRRALGALAAKYRQYRDQPPPGPVIAIAMTGRTSWSADS